MELLIPDDFLDYLLANGFTARTDDRPYCVNLSNGQLYIEIRRTGANFWQWLDAGEDFAPDFICIGEVRGLERMSLFGWQLLLHSFGIVRIHDFARRVRQSKEMLSETSLFNQLGEILRPEKV